MTREEARKLMPLYLDGKLDAIQATELEDALEHSPDLQSEMRALEENTVLPLPVMRKGDSGILSEQMLSEALAPLRPSRSARMRLSDTLADVHRHAQHVANTLPEQGWRLFRLCFVLGALATAVLLVMFYPRPIVLTDERYILRYSTVGAFAIGLLLVLAARLLAQVEAFIVGIVSKREPEPTRLEVLMLEVFGIFATLSSGAMYIYQMWY